MKTRGFELPLGPDGKLDVSTAVGWFGELTVVRDLGMKEPYVGRCNLVSGEIAEDFAQYFVMSEQQPSLVYLGVRVDPQSGTVRAGGGLMIQPLPQCPEEDLDALQARAEGIKAMRACWMTAWSWKRRSPNCSRGFHGGKPNG